MSPALENTLKALHPHLSDAEIFKMWNSLTADEYAAIVVEMRRRGTLKSVDLQSLTDGLTSRERQGYSLATAIKNAADAAREHHEPLPGGWRAN